MKFNFKYLILPLSIMVCISGNYINAMDLKENEIDTNNNINITMDNNINLHNIKHFNTNNDHKMLIKKERKEIITK